MYEIGRLKLQNLSEVTSDRFSAAQTVHASVETKIFVFVFSRKFREYLFSLFAKYLKMSNPDGTSKQIGQQ
jgi:hypothetical protein